jgi:ABC-2 type transport system ATP-binding protein
LSVVPDQASAIHVAELTKIFKVPERDAGLRAAAHSVVRRKTREVRAVDSISFETEPGEVVGFLGPRSRSSRGSPSATTRRSATDVGLVTSGQNAGTPFLASP